MARLLPFRSDTPSREGRPRVVDLGDEDADAVFSALSSTTARLIYATLDDEPATPSDVADAIDSSIQNVRYHLEKLEAAGLVEVVDTWYSSRGNEMSVYATADGPLIVTSDRSKAEQLKTALSRFVGGVGALAGGSLLVQFGIERFFGPTAPADDAASGTNGGLSGDDAQGASEEDAPGEGDHGTTGDDRDASATGEDGDETPDADDAGAGTADVDEEEAPADADGAETTDEPGSEPIEDGGATDGGGAVDGNGAVDNGGAVDDGGVIADNVSNGAPEAAETVFSSIPPGLLFFLGGLVVLIAVTVYWYYTSY